MDIFNSQQYHISMSPPLWFCYQHKLIKPLAVMHEAPLWVKHLIIVWGSWWEAVHIVSQCSFQENKIQMKTNRGYLLRTSVAMVSAIATVFCRYSKSVKRLGSFDVCGLGWWRWKQSNYKYVIDFAKFQVIQISLDSAHS